MQSGKKAVEAIGDIAMAANYKRLNEA